MIDEEQARPWEQLGAAEQDRLIAAEPDDPGPDDEGVEDVDVEPVEAGVWADTGEPSEEDEDDYVAGVDVRPGGEPQ